MSVFEFPQIHSFPPFFTQVPSLFLFFFFLSNFLFLSFFLRRQINLETATKQLQLWADVVLAYTRANKVLILNMDEPVILILNMINQLQIIIIDFHCGEKIS